MTGPVSAGVLVYRWRPAGPEFLLVHPGGPFWARRDEAAWSIPKGLTAEGEDGWAAAVREFAEELGRPMEQHRAEARALAPCRTPGGKWVHAWLVEADFDPPLVASNEFELEWPKGSGRMRRFPEVDKAGYFAEAEALWKIHRGQRPILEEAVERLKDRAQ